MYKSNELYKRKISNMDDVEHDNVVVVVLDDKEDDKKTLVFVGDNMIVELHYCCKVLEDDNEK